jgi:hypothetical protein
MVRQVLNRLKNLFDKIGKVGSQRLDDGSVVLSVAGVKMLHGRLDRGFQKDRCTIIEWVGAGNIRSNPRNVDGE